MADSYTVPACLSRMAAERGPPGGQGPFARAQLDRCGNTAKATAAGPPTAEPSGLFPSSAPAVPGPMMGSVFHKSSQGSG